MMELRMNAHGAPERQYNDEAWMTPECCKSHQERITPVMAIKINLLAVSAFFSCFFIRETDFIFLMNFTARSRNALLFYSSPIVVDMWRLNMWLLRFVSYVKILK